MKKKIKDTKAFKIARSLLFGAIESPLKPLSGAVIGIVEGVKQIKKDNLKSEVGGVGKVDYARLVGYLIFIGLTALFILGKIDKETFNFLVESSEGLN